MREYRTSPVTGLVAKSELTKPMQNYLELHRHSAVRNESLGHSGLALRLAVAQMIAGSFNLRAVADRQKANSDAISNCLATNKAEDRFFAKRQTIRDLIGYAEMAIRKRLSGLKRNGAE